MTELWITTNAPSAHDEGQARWDPVLLGAKGAPRVPVVPYVRECAVQTTSSCSHWPEVEMIVEIRGLDDENQSELEALQGRCANEAWSEP